MAPKVDSDGTVYIPFRARWEMIDECRFHMKNENIRYLGEYVRQALKHYNQVMTDKPDEKV